MRNGAFLSVFLAAVVACGCVARGPHRQPSSPGEGAGSDVGSWPQFRGTRASGVADDRNVPETWDVETGENLLWKTRIPGLSHASPVVWGDRIFVTSAISTAGDHEFKPGLYGDGDASEDRSVHRWIVMALDKHTGEVLWERTAHEGVPTDKRHVKATYNNSSPATDGRHVVALFGSEGLFAFDVDGKLLWKRDLGRLDVGAYDAPEYEWGSASSPIIHDGLVFVQCDTQGEDFVQAMNVETGEVAWRTGRDELPSWGTPTIWTAGGEEVLATNGSNFIRGYDPTTGEELWRLGGSSRITAPTPVFDEETGLLIVASGRGPEQPIFAIRPGARGDITLAEGEWSSEAIAWATQRRGPYMPTPLIYGDSVYVLKNDGIWACYDLHSGEKHYRVRLKPTGSGFSASPVASGERIYIPSEDGRVFVVLAGPELMQIAVNSIPDLLMASPAISEGVLYLRGKDTLWAIGSPD